MASTITMDPTVFRAMFPAFADTVAYPDAALSAQFDMATGYVSPEVSGDLTEAIRRSAVYLMTAHLLYLSALIAAGKSPAVVQSAGIDQVQVTLQPPPVRGQWRWWLSTSPYGLQLTALLDAQSVGGFFVGGIPERDAFRKAYGVF